jgi:hypothetical protein
MFQESQMKMIKRSVLCLAAVLAGLAIAGAAKASAQDVYKVNYFDNNFVSFGGYAVPDGRVRIDNPGLTYGNLCAEVYVFSSDQQMTECCGCIESHNGLSKFSIRNSLTSNPLTGIVPINGVIKVVSATTNNNCNPAIVTPKANLRVWVTHIQDGTSMGSFGGLVWPETETESSDSTLGAAELAALQAQCTFIQVLGSGHGICSCGVGDD